MFLNNNSRILLLCNFFYWTVLLEIHNSNSLLFLSILCNIKWQFFERSGIFRKSLYFEDIFSVFFKNFSYFRSCTHVTIFLYLSPQYTYRVTGVAVEQNNSNIFFKDELRTINRRISTVLFFIIIHHPTGIHPITG